MPYPASATLVAAIVFVCGCQAPPQIIGPTVERVSITEGGLDSLWDAIGDALRSYSFRLDRQDRVNGVITTFPETTAQAVEFARPQPTTAYYWWEANLQTIQRKVTVQVTPSELAGEYNVDVQVERFRYSLEERQIDNPAAALRLFSSDTPTASGQMAKVSESSQWVPLGRDEGMEKSIIVAIQKRYSPVVAVTRPE